MNLSTYIAPAIALVLLAGAAPSLHGQVTPRYSPPAGNFVIDPNQAAEPVTSFSDLIRSSSLIVDGTVVSVLPTIVLTPNVPGSVDTDALVSIRQVIRGKPSTPGQVLLMQAGGTQGKWNVTVSGDSLVQAGERYILFLARDYRTSLPNSFGILPDASVAARYYSVGFGNGKALVSATETIQFRPGAVPASHQYDGNAVSSFITTIQNQINALFPPAPPYPKGTKPVPAPPGGPFAPTNKQGSNSN